MIAKDVRMTIRLERMIAATHDGPPGAPPLRVTPVGDEIDVVKIVRADGSELSEHERRRVMGLLAAHAVEPIE